MLPKFSDWLTEQAIPSLMTEMTHSEKEARDIFVGAFKDWFSFNHNVLSEEKNVDLDPDAVAKLGAPGTAVSIENVPGKQGIPAVNSRGVCRGKAFVKDAKGNVWVVEGAFDADGSGAKEDLVSLVFRKHHVVVKWTKKGGF